MKETKKSKELEEIEIPNYFDEDIYQSTGLIQLDAILGGGLKSGITQLVGETNCGRTTISLQISYNFCIEGKNVLFIDSCASISRERLIQLGLGPFINNGFYYIRSLTFDDVEEKIDKFLATGKIDLIVIDTISNIINSGYLDTSKKGLKTSNNNTNCSTRPLALLTNKLQKLSILNKFCVLFINEMRSTVHKKLGTMPKIFGPKTLEYNSNVILKIKTSISTKEELNKNFSTKFQTLKDKHRGILCEFEVIKSNLYPSSTSIPYFFMFTDGVSNIAAILYVLIKTNNIEQNGTYYLWHGKSLNGIDATYNEALERNIIKNEIKSICIEYYIEQLKNAKS